MEEINSLYANFKSGQIDQETFVRNIESLVGSDIDMPQTDIVGGSLDERITTRDGIIKQQANQLANAKKGFDKLKEQKTKLQEEKRNLSLQLKIKTTELEQATIKVDNLENEIRTKKSEINDLNLKVLALQKQNDKDLGTIKGLKNEISTKKSEIDGLNSKVLGLTNSKENAERELNGINQRLTQTEQVLQETVKKEQKASELLNNLLRLLQDAIDNIQTQNAILAKAKLADQQGSDGLKKATEQLKGLGDNYFDVSDDSDDEY